MIDFRLYVITDRHRCAPTPLIEVISELLDAGVTAIQLREKDLNSDELMRLAQPIADLCRNYKAKLFVNTDTRVAATVGAAGVHLPANAASVSSVKAQIGANFSIGCSVHTFAEAGKRETEGADFLTYSPIYLTASKPGYGPPVGVENLTKLVGRVKLPIFALGGITPARASECLLAGAFGIAVMSGVMAPKNSGKLAKHYLETLV